MHSKYTPMKHNSNAKKQVTNLVLVFITLICLVITSCKETTNPIGNTDNDLMEKINAVQEQIMAQGTMSMEEENAILSLCSIVSQEDGMANYDINERMALKDVDTAPIFQGCEGLIELESRECFKNKVASFIKREFEVSISKDLNLSKPKQVEAFFIIDQNGKTTGMKVRDSEVTIQAEILRVLRKMPVLEPAIHDGEKTAVVCSIVVKYGNDINVDIVYIPELPG